MDYQHAPSWEEQLGFYTLLTMLALGIAAMIAPESVVTAVVRVVLGWAGVS